MLLAFTNKARSEYLLGRARKYGVNILVQILCSLSVLQLSLSGIQINVPFFQSNSRTKVPPSSSTPVSSAQSLRSQLNSLARPVNYPNDIIRALFSKPNSKIASSSTDKLSHASKIDPQAHNSLLKPNSQLDHALTNSAAHGLPAIAISPLQGQYLAIQCQLINAKTVLEIGTLGGYSTI